MLSGSVNQNMVQQLQVVIIFLTEIILSLYHSRQSGRGGQKSPFDCVLAYSNS